MALAETIKNRYKLFHIALHDDDDDENNFFFVFLVTCLSCLPLSASSVNHLVPSSRRAPLHIFFISHATPFVPIMYHVSCHLTQLRLSIAVYDHNILSRYIACNVVIVAAE